MELVDAGDGESSKVDNMITAGRAAALIGTTKTQLARALTHRVVASKREVVETPQNKHRATYARDAMAKVSSCDLLFHIIGYTHMYCYIQSYHS